MQNSLKIKNWVLNWDNFRKVYLFLCLVYFMPSSFDIEKYPLWICFFWGISIIAIDFFTRREMFKSKYWYILILMSLVYLLSIAVNYKFQLVRGIYNFVYLVTTFFIIYPINTKQSTEEVKKNMTQFNNVLIYTVFIAGLISVLMFIFNISYFVPISAANARQGFVASRLFGVYTSPNIGAIFGFLSIVLSILNNLIKRGTWYKFTKFYLANIVVQSLYFILASSRGTELTIMVFSLLSLLFIVVPYFIQTYKKKSEIIFRTLLVFLLFFGISLGFTGVLKEGLSYVPGLVQQSLTKIGINEPTADENASDKENVDKITIQHSPEDAELSSGRFTIWKAAVNVIKQFPILGTTDSYFYRNDIEYNAQIDESKLSELDINELKRAHGNMHNVYIQTLVMSGILGFATIAIFIVLHLKDNLIFLLKQRKITIDYQIIAMMFFLILALLVEDLVESHIIFNIKDVVSIVFWYYLSLLNYFRTEKKIVDGVIEK
ncbi:O-antigen ligase family protein [Carnobacterium sp. TMP28]|uniref:O-antigen ligase family protein n=1 Tax=Carnobacterium sp. TMP28 TaxID=3397060 RepID=UPI0039E1D779